MIGYDNFHDIITFQSADTTYGRRNPKGVMPIIFQALKHDVARDDNSGTYLLHPVGCSVLPPPLKTLFEVG